MNRVGLPTKNVKSAAPIEDDAYRQAVDLLQEHVSGPQLDALANEVILKLHDADSASVERDLISLAEQLGEALKKSPGISESLAVGLVYATLTSIRTRLATAHVGGTA